jgi:hypothetical protein
LYGCVQYLPFFNINNGFARLMFFCIVSPKMLLLVSYKSYIKLLLILGIYWQILAKFDRVSQISL